MEFTLPASLEILERTPAVLSAMLTGLSDNWANGNEGANTWTPKEVIAHLIVCENTNWMPRVRIILSDERNKVFEPIGMDAHFEIAKSNSTDTLLTEFVRLRQKSITELRGFNLSEADFEKSAFHPKIAEVSLGQLIAAWVAHDLSHITQVSRTLAQQYKNEVGPFTEFLKILK
ncbi:DinB family protein [Flavobacterium pallidum]|uniref:DinB-like domain-containing protein n=1 Tax=Flavobacterium pallidum TaxID=2172098 RepID=A0A2S1SJ01_9FLAO|nr:DinB family protein [Flavobacterium pallidum]AWI26327.1 hypothetical protein HYN49_10675 [Flavobacterium pallidum]